MPTVTERRFVWVISPGTKLHDGSARRVLIENCTLKRDVQEGSDKLTLQMKDRGAQEAFLRTPLGAAVGCVKQSVKK